MERPEEGKVSLNDRQTKVLNKLFSGFEGKLTREKWMKMTKASSRTALRDIEELIALGIIEQEEAGGRSTSYRLHKILADKVSDTTEGGYNLSLLTPEELTMESGREEPVSNDGHWTRNRQELLKWLVKSSPSLAELYKGAVDLLFGRPVTGFSRFVSHAVREIRNRLPGVVSGTGSSGRLDYMSRIDDLSAQWKKARISVEATSSDDGRSRSAAGASEVVLPRKVARRIENLIADHDAARQRPQEAATKLFEGIAPSNQRFRDRLRPVLFQWMEVCNWFMERTHESGFTDADIDLEEFKKNFELFESTLLAIVRGVSTFFDNTDELDAILKERPTPELVEAAIARMGHGEFHRYFFEKLENPEWIRPLREKKFFSSPPAPVRDDVEGTITFAVWPESRYLFRMSNLDPKTVTEVVLRMPETENTRVHDDLVDIALAVTGPSAASWFRKPRDGFGRGTVYATAKDRSTCRKAGRRWRSERPRWIWPEHCSKSCQTEPVLSPEPVGHMDAWHYERILRKDITALVAVAGLPALELLADLLARADQLSQNESDNGDFEDYSFVWRPTIEHGRGFSRGVRDPLMSAVLDAALHLVTNDRASVADIVLALERRKWTLFHRIALHVLRLFGTGF